MDQSKRPSVDHKGSEYELFKVPLPWAKRPAEAMVSRGTARLLILATATVLVSYLIMISLSL